MNELQSLTSRRGLMRSLRLWAGRRFPPFNGSNLFSTSKHNEVLAAVNCFLNPQIIISNRTAITITDGGWIIEIDGSQLGGATQSASGSAGTYLLKSVQGDYVTAGTWDGNVVGPDVYIAKPYKLRNSINAAVIFGVLHGYGYSAGPDAANVKRTNSANGNSEVEYVTPPWIPSSIIGQNVGADVLYAIQATTLVTGGNGKDCGLLMVGDSRQWAAL